MMPCKLKAVCAKLMRNMIVITAINILGVGADISRLQKFHVVRGVPILNASPMPVPEGLHAHGVDTHARVNA